ncbi:MAG: hypothetical protein P8X66_11210 [Maritimibacter sp.]
MISTQTEPTIIRASGRSDSTPAMKMAKPVSIISRPASLCVAIQLSVSLSVQGVRMPTKKPGRLFGMALPIIRNNTPTASRIRLTDVAMPKAGRPIAASITTIISMMPIQVMRRTGAEPSSRFCIGSSEGIRANRNATTISRIGGMIRASKAGAKRSISPIRFQ